MKNRFLNRTVLLLMFAWLTACSAEEEIALPVVEPENPAELNTLFAIHAGDEAYRSQDFNLEYRSEDGTRQIELRAVFGECNTPCPIVLFSHGMFSSNQEYDRLLKHWASHGAVVLAAQHVDGGGMVKGIFNTLRYGQLNLFKMRTDDMSAMIDQLELVADKIERTLDATQVIAAGHSFGGFTAQQMIGAQAYDPDSDVYLKAGDDRVRAAVSVSPPGPMFDYITEQSWKAVTKPMLITTGTRDTDAKFWPDWRLHKMSFDTAPPGEKYALVVDGADHYLGNLICRTDREAKPQQHALMMVQSATTAFIAKQTQSVSHTAVDSTSPGKTPYHPYFQNTGTIDIADGFATVYAR